MAFLHDLGIALRFSDLPLRDTNVINPRWLTEGVYRLINCPDVAESGGVLATESLNALLPPDQYPPEKHHFIVSIMRKFELCYELDANRVLFPTLLPIEEPKIPSPSEAGSVRFVI